jgi:hypothetical protein
MAHDDGKFNFIMTFDSFWNENRRRCFLDGLNGFILFRDYSCRGYNGGPWFEKVKWFCGSFIAEFSDVIPSESTNWIENDKLKDTSLSQEDLRVISADCNNISAILPIGLWVAHFW